MPNNDAEKEDALQAYMGAEANLMSQIHDCVVEVNNILKAMAGNEASNLKTYMAREDYKTMFNMDDALIDQWIYYADKIMGKGELVNEMPEKSFINSKKQANPTKDVTRGGVADKGNQQ
jgi:hypothetical protein